MLAGQGLLPGVGRTLQEASQIHQPEMPGAWRSGCDEEASALSIVGLGQAFQLELSAPWNQTWNLRLGSRWQDPVSLFYVH